MDPLNSPEDSIKSTGSKSAETKKEPDPVQAVREPEPQEADPQPKSEFGQKRSLLRARKCPMKTLLDYRMKQLKEESIFRKVSSPPTSKEMKDVDTSILVKGFAMRNLESFQRVLLKDEADKLRALKEAEAAEEAQTFSEEDVSTEILPTELSKESEVSADRKRLEYLMGLEIGGEEEMEKMEEVVGVEVEKEKVVGSGVSAAVREAQKYLRNHRIFEFFQYLIAYMLSSIPENPIDFILQLLDKCLLYRSGAGKPPLLYNKPHIEQLFKLMDRMGTGYIEYEQYRTGMATLGLCDFNTHPEMTPDKQVPKEVFIEETYEALAARFDDMIMPKWGTGKSMMQSTPRISQNIPTQFDGFQFIPRVPLFTDSFFRPVEKTKKVQSQRLYQNPWETLKDMSDHSVEQSEN